MSGDGSVGNQRNGGRVRLLLLHDQGLLRTSLARVLSLERGFEIMAECGSSVEAMKVLSTSAIDVIVLDLDLLAGLTDLISGLRACDFQGRLLALADAEDAERSATALRLGASGVFLKTETPDRLVEAIRRVASGAAWVDRSIIQFLAEQWITEPLRAADRKSGDALEQREQNVLLGVLGGLTNRRIANNMGISECSVKNTLHGLFARAGVRTRSQLVRLALEGSLGNIRHLIRQQAKEQAREVVTAKAGELPATTTTRAGSRSRRPSPS